MFYFFIKSETKFKSTKNVLNNLAIFVILLFINNKFIVCAKAMKKKLVFNFIWSFTQNKICFNMSLSEFDSM